MRYGQVIQNTIIVKKKIKWSINMTLVINGLWDEATK